MKQIRLGVFETNSSSTHSLTIFSKEQFKQFEEGKLLLDISDYGNDKFVTLEEAMKIIESDEDFEIDNDLDEDDKKEYIKACLSNHEIFSVDTLDPNLEHEDTEFTTPAGEEYVIVCRFGNDNC